MERSALGDVAGWPASLPRDPPASRGDEPSNLKSGPSFLRPQDEVAEPDKLSSFSQAAPGRPDRGDMPEQAYLNELAVGPSG
jgi:hypothetical protein